VWVQSLKRGHLGPEGACGRYDDYIYNQMLALVDEADTPPGMEPPNISTYYEYMVLIDE
jgi:hypothetical protein